MILNVLVDRVNKNLHSAVRTGVLKNVFVKNSAVALVATVKGVHVSGSPRRRQSGHDGLPDLFVKAVGVSKEERRGRL